MPASTERRFDADRDAVSTQPLFGGSVPSADVGALLGAPLQTMPPNEGALDAGASLTPVDKKRDEAVEAAFDQLGDSEYALPSPSSDRVRLQSWLSGTPLLLMLALERMTARKSRRRRATDSIVAVVRPQLC